MLGGGEARAGNVALFIRARPRRSCEQVSQPGARSGPRSGDGHARLTWSPNRGALVVQPAARGFLAGVARNVLGDELHRSALSLRFSRRSNALGVHAVTRSRSMLSIIAAYGLYVCSASCRFKGVPACACRRAGENILLERRRAPRSLPLHRRASV